MNGVEDEQLYARVAWLYHKEDRTQGEIADILGLTRLRVNRILAECRASGLVRVSLNTRFESCVILERRLVEEHGLADAVISPTPFDPDQTHALVGQAAGDFLARYLRRSGAGRIGVGWGATLREAIRSMEPMEQPDSTVTAMMGGLTQGSELNTFEIAHDLARRLNAQCSYFAAPIYASSRQSRDTILQQPVFTEVLAQARSVQVAFLSLGNLTTHSLLIRHGLPPGVTPGSLTRAGAVGDILGQFIDRDGVPVEHELNGRVVGLALPDLARIPTVVLAAGGLHKAAAISAALRGRLARVLVSDEDTVTAALALVKRP